MRLHDSPTGEPVDSPACSLANFRFGEQAAQITIITGWRGAGKTTWCKALVQQARQAGLTTGGFLTPPRIRHNQKIAIELHNLLTDERRVLARWTGSPTQTTTGCWNFDETVLQWGNDILRASSNVDVLFIDELGPLEFTACKGFQAGLELLDAGTFKQAVVIVRPELLSLAQTRWPDTAVIDLGGKALA